jgi:putative membrane protein
LDVAVSYRHFCGADFTKASVIKEHLVPQKIGAMTNFRHREEPLMIRRQMLATLAATAFVPAILAAPQVFAADTAPMGEAEKKHADMTKMTGALALATSRVALMNATGGMVKRFAKFEVAEQETIADILKSMTMDKAEGALKVPTDSEVEAMLDPAGKDMLAKIKGLKGAEFDKEYVAGQLDGHKKLLMIQEDYLKVGQNREHLNVAKLARGMVKEHIDHLEMIKA